MGKIALLAVVLLAALLVARTCGSRDERIDQDEAVAIAKEQIDFTPCTETGCIVVRAVNQGIPPRLVWIVGLAESLDAEGRPTRFRNFLVDALTGEVERAR